MIDLAGLARISLAPAEPCLGLRPGTGRLLSSEKSDESSYPLIILSQGLQTRMDPDCSNCAPERSDVHFASNIWPHVPASARKYSKVPGFQVFTYYSDVSGGT